MGGRFINGAIACTLAISIVFGGITVFAAGKLEAKRDGAGRTALTSESGLRERHMFLGEDKEIRFGGISVEMLVEKGIIDQNTADEMKAFLDEKAAEIKAEMESGTAEMKAEMEKRVEEKKAALETIKNITEEERAEYFKNKADSFKAERPERIEKMEKRIDIFSEMVSEGILTQTQADEIKALAPQKPARPEAPFTPGIKIPEPDVYN